MLRLIEERDGLWELFQEGDPSVEAPVVPRWERAARLGVRADGPAPPEGVAADDLVVRRDASLDAFADGRTILDGLSNDAASRGLLALVADAHGVIVRSTGGDAFPREVARTRLVEGARWDEAARGTNAIGTALVERQPIAVVGRAHWEHVNHGLFCYAAPVLDPFGDLLAVLDVTGPVELDERAIGVAVRGAAASLEEILRARAYCRTNAGSLPLLSRMIDRCSGPSLLVEAPGTVRTRNAAAAAELELPAGATSVEHVFGMPWDELALAARSGPASFETRRRRYTVEFEPVLADGRVLALACFLSPAPRPRASLAPAAGSRAALATPARAHVSLSAFEEVFAHDPAVIRAKHVAASLAPSDVPILLLAETGTGKELFAHAIHRASARAAQPFVAINCGALVGGLLETELFGYGAGAFTGAQPRGSEGKLAAAHRGTLFLDELAEMSPQAQAMLLRFLEDGSYHRVGESTPRHADVRVLAATCRDLPALVQSGAFRQDLFYRINGGNIRLPALAERTDRLALARQLLERLTAGSPRPSAGAPGVTRPPSKRRACLAPSAEAWVLDHPWPGNVRELKTALAHALALATAGRAATGSNAADVVELERAHFPEPLIVGGRAAHAEAPSSRKRALQTLAEEAVSRAGGNMSEAARALGVARSTLYRMLARPSRS
ncbi:MAG: sigma-54-dependent Fis family transcriptional regulator [Labilithrix sp.]|nr:sigma-54-dependent Fis family transcriptional regulator [Labilithrix sp.]